MRLRSGEATGSAAEFRAPPTARPVTGQRCRSPSPLAQTAGKIGMRSFVQTIIVALGVACCASACTQEQKAGCVIKGNIASSGERIPGTALLRQKFGPCCGDAHERLPGDGMRHPMFGAILIL